MDNVTHTLAGLLLAESAIQLRRRRTGVEPSSRLRSIAAVSSAFAANLPDADILYTGWGTDRLGYLLHHRGHTHTVLVGIVGAALLSAVVLLFWRWRAGSGAPRGEARWLCGLLLVGVLSHLLLDWTNSYGVHPFWPVDDRWYYGDAVFIVEPWLWVVSIPALVVASPRLVSRALLSFLLVAVLTLAWYVDMVSATAAGVLSAGAVLSILAAHRLPPMRRAAGAAGAWIVVTLVMMAGTARARAVALRDVRAQVPTTGILDVVVSPLPANPVCHSVIVAGRTGDIYRVAMARVSAVPSLTTAGACGQRERPAGIFGPSAWVSSEAIQWDREWTASVSDLARIARESCPALAGLRFMRVPVWITTGDTVLLGDARFGGGSGSSFSDISVPRHSTTCPDAVPPWIPPRAELLGPP